MNKFFLISLLLPLALIASEPHSNIFSQYQKDKKALEKKLDQAETQIAMNSATGAIAELAENYMYRALDYRLRNTSDIEQRIALFKEQSEWEQHCRKFDGESQRSGSIFPMLQGAMSQSRNEQRAFELRLPHDRYFILKEIQKFSIPYEKSERALAFAELIKGDRAIARISDYFGKWQEYHYAVIEPTKYLCCGEENPNEFYLCIWRNGKVKSIRFIGTNIKIEKISVVDGAVIINGEKEKGKPFQAVFPFNSKQMDKINFSYFD